MLMGVINFFSIPGFLVGSLIFLLGVITLFSERRLRISGSFFLLTSSTALWLSSYGCLFSIKNPSPQQILFFSQLAHMGVSFIPGFIVLFISSVVRTSPFFRIWVFISVGISCLFCLINLKTNLWIHGAKQFFWGVYPQYGIFSIAFVLFFFVALFSGLFMLGKGYKNALSERAKGRLKALLTAFSVGSLASVDYFANYGIEVYPVGYLPIFFFIVLTADTMRRYHLSDVTPAFAAEKILETMQGVVLGIDLDGIIRMANRSACEILGYDKMELLGMPAKRIMSEGLSSVNRDIPLAQHLFTGKDKNLRNYETQWTAKNGQLIHFSVSASVMRGRVGDKGEGIIYVAQDLTERLHREEVLRESEDRFRSVTESANDAIISADSEGNILSWNRGARHIFGYDSDEVLHKPLTLLMPEKYRESHARGLQRLSVSGESSLIGKVVELIGLRKNGEEFPIELSLSSWRSTRGVFYSGIIRDISQRKKLQDERDRYFNLPLDMLCTADFDGYFRQLNPAWEKTLGWSIEELMARPWIEFVHPDDRSVTMTQGEKLKAGLSITAFENRYLCKDGYYKTFLWSATVPPGENLIYAAARDITESKKNRQMRLRLASIVESSNDAVLIVSEDGEIWSWNRGAEKIYGYSTAEVIGKPLAILFPENRTESVKNIIEGGLCDGGIENFETVGVRKGGVPIQVSLTVSPIKDETEHRKTISLIGRNITKVKEAEEVLRHRKDLEMKSNFISMVSHELRTPLTVIKMSVDILKNGEAGPLGPQQIEWIDMCFRNVSRLSRLISKVLDFQKLESGQMKYEFEETDLNEIIRETEKSTRMLLGEKAVELKLDLSPDLPRLQLDRDKIVEVITNIMDNASKFTQAGSIFVKTIELEGVVRTTIQDTGIGIRPEDLPRLFSSFTQLHATEHRIGGTGLGLSISKKIIEQHGGQIWAESVEGKGTTFFIDLPLSRTKNN